MADAIRKAEQATAGEIYCVVARSSDSYYFAAAFVSLLSILAVSLGMAVIIEIQWLSLRLPWFVAAQLLAFAGLNLLLMMRPGLALFLAPRRLQFARAHDNAVKQFLARNVHITAERTGVLIFVSLAEHYAEIIADSGINAHVEQQVWDGIVDDLIEQARAGRLTNGFVRAADAVGKLLAAHVPPRAADRNELDDHLVEI